MRSFGRSCKCYFREYLWPFADDIEVDIVEKTGVTADSVLPRVQRQALSVSHSLPLDMLNFDLLVAFCTLESFAPSSWTLVLATFQTKGTVNHYFVLKGRIMYSYCYLLECLAINHTKVYL